MDVDRSHAPVALITGGGSGIGAATASVLCATGWSVVICGRRAAALQAVADATGAHPITTDVTDPDAAARPLGRPLRGRDELVRRCRAIGGDAVDLDPPSGVFPQFLAADRASSVRRSPSGFHGTPSK